MVEVGVFGRGWGVWERPVHACVDPQTVVVISVAVHPAASAVLTPPDVEM